MIHTGEQIVRLPAWSRSPELLRATTPGKPPEPHVDNRLHDYWAMGCLVFEALTALPLFGNHMDAYEAQAVAALVHAGSSDQDEQDDDESQAAVDMRFVLLQHELWVSLCFLHPMTKFESKSLQLSNVLSCIPRFGPVGRLKYCQKCTRLPDKHFV